MSDFGGRNVVITGADGGLGPAVVAAFAGAGAVCHLPLFEADATGPGGPNVHSTPGIDLTSEPAVEAYYAGLPSLFASVHLTGGFAARPIAETTLKDLEKMLRLNLASAFLCCREALKAIRRAGAGGGRIVNVGARVSEIPVGGMVSYSISKAGVAALTRSLAVEVKDEKNREGKLAADPVSLLEALRRSAERFAIFCQAGRIAVPRPDRLLLSYLERSVFQVSAPNGGVFHPKVWVLRLLDEQESVHYRVVCSTRNITFDRSWDTVLTLDGALVERKNAIAANHPLGDFVRALPEMALAKVPALRGAAGVRGAHA